MFLSVLPSSFQLPAVHVRAGGPVRRVPELLHGVSAPLPALLSSFGAFGGGSFLSLLRPFGGFSLFSRLLSFGLGCELRRRGFRRRVRGGGPRRCRCRRGGRRYLCPQRPNHVATRKACPAFGCGGRIGWNRGVCDGDSWSGLGPAPPAQLETAGFLRTSRESLNTRHPAPRVSGGAAGWWPSRQAATPSRSASLSPDDVVDFDNFRLARI